MNKLSKLNSLAVSTALVIMTIGSPLYGASMVPEEATIDGSTANKTIWPKPGKTGGELSWKSHKRNLTGWSSISEDDTRGAPAVKKASLDGPLNGDPERGKKLAAIKLKGNCVACHQIPGVSQTGDVGPSLVGYKDSGKSAAELYQQIYDSRAANPDTNMPPFGSFGTLTDQEIRDVVAYIMTLGS